MRWLTVLLAAAGLAMWSGCGESGSSSGLDGKAKVTTSSGATYEGDNIPSPLSAEAAAGVTGRDVRFALACRTSKGEAVRSVFLPSGRQAEAPTIEVYDSSNKLIHSCTLKYG